jgi:hypothetical protein
MSYYQIIIAFPKDAVVLFVPENKVSSELYDQMCCSMELPPALIQLSDIISPTYIIGDGYATMPDIKINKIFTFTS